MKSSQHDDRQLKIEKLFWQHMEIQNFADAYPTGEKLKRLLATPPHLRNLPAATESAAETATRPQLHAGKSLDQWIAQAKQAANLEDRHYAIQVVRNFGLRIERVKTLRVFTEWLSDDVPTIRSLPAEGIRSAGRPTDPEALDKLVELLSQDISEIRLPPGVGEVGGELGSLMRAVSALGILGDTTRVPVLKRIAGNEKIDPLLRQAAKKAIQDIAAREEASDKERAAAIKKLEFLIGIWKSVAPDNAAPNNTLETRSITMQPAGLGQRHSSGREGRISLSFKVLSSVSGQSRELRSGTELRVRLLDLQTRNAARCKMIRWCV